MDKLVITVEDVKKVLEVLNDYKRNEDEIIKLYVEDIKKIDFNEAKTVSELKKDINKIPKIDDYKYDIDKLVVDMVNHGVLIKKKDIKKIIKLFVN